MRYGPQTTEVEQLINRLRQLSPDEIQGLANAWDAPTAAARAAVRAAKAAAWADARDARDGWDAWDARDGRDAWDDANDAKAAAWGISTLTAPAGLAAGDAALALACRHLIGDVFTWTHYRTLVGPAATVLGPVHPDDQEHR